jgi:hypothetical protein
MWILISLAAAAFLFGITGVIIVVRSSDGCESEEDPFEVPGEDYMFGERPSYDSYKSLN